MFVHIIILYIICILIVLFIAYHYNTKKDVLDKDFEEIAADVFDVLELQLINKKLDEINKAVSSLDESLEKANKIEADVEELKRKVH